MLTFRQSWFRANPIEFLRIRLKIAQTPTRFPMKCVNIYVQHVRRMGFYALFIEYWRLRNRDNNDKRKINV